MKQNKEKKKKSEHLGLAIIAITVVFVPVATYLAVQQRGHIPTMPSPVITQDEMARSFQVIRSRVKTFSLNEEEQALVDQLEAVHLLETQPRIDAKSASKLKEHMARLQTSLTHQAKNNKERYLLLGDSLALRFHHALKTLLQAKHDTKEIASNKLKPSKTLVRRVGGAFLSRATEQGLITENGQLNAYRITPQILFRYRWRRLARLDPTVGFSDTERKALYDFTINFTSSRNLARRLSAVDELVKIDSSYDTAVAKSLILLESGKRTEAIDFLTKARKTHPNRPKVDSFLKALKE